VFSYLQIYDPRERAAVGLADAGLRMVRAATRLMPGRRAATPPKRILLLRLERIGDLLMSAPAIQAVRAYAPDAAIDLMVGSWNVPLAELIPGIDGVETLDAPWLARGAAGADTRSLIARAWRWRARRYDLAINFEGDIRSHALMALSGAPLRVGFDMAGGGPLLTHRVDHRPQEHTTANAWRLVHEAFRATGSVRASGVQTAAETRPPFRLALPEAVRTRAAEMLRSGKPTSPSTLSPEERGLVLATFDAARGGGGDGAHAHGPVIGLHASGGRAIKQWPARRFGEVAARLLAERPGATLLLTGAPADRALVDEVLGVVRASLAAHDGAPSPESRAGVASGLLPDHVGMEAGGRETRAGDVARRIIDLTGEVELPLLAALLERCDVYITGDTGPMHLAAAVGTPIAAVFGPSMPWRYAPISTTHRIVRIDLPCAPCNRIRLPPERCQGHTPDCLEGVTVDAVYRAAVDLLDQRLHDRDQRDRPKQAPNGTDQNLTDGQAPDARPLLL
jgi:ADP-heptose:LPS heptosyltransferase